LPNDILRVRPHAVVLTPAWKSSSKHDALQFDLTETIPCKLL